jgi:DNA-binding CsgD family transcriptional regulator
LDELIYREGLAMPDLSIEVVSKILDATDIDHLFGEVEAAARSMGFERFLLGLEIKRPLLPALHHVCSGYPEAWQLIYAQRNYVMMDPTVGHCQTRTDPLVWAEDHYDASRELWEEARAFGISHGMSVPVHGRDGIKSMMSFARDQAITDPRELDAMLAGARVLASCAHLVASRIIMPTLLEGDPKLTAREQECLGWAARGKTAAEIAMILRISEPTAIHHLNNVVRKFNVANRTQAVAVGVAMGLVQ